jgi:hypothetical protein
MTIRRNYAKNFHGVKVKSGYVYSFKYQAWENDPEPTVIIMYALEGVHPNTGHQWRFFQGINFTYIPRSERRRFASDWMRIFTSTKNAKFTWELVKRKYPYLKHAVRRYFFKPDYYITKLREIPFEQMEAAIVSTWSKDFSKKIKSSLFNKFRNIFRNREQFKKTGKFPSRSEKQQQKLQRKVYGEKPSTQGSRQQAGGQGVKGNIQQGPSRYDNWGWS